MFEKYMQIEIDHIFQLNFFVSSTLIFCRKGKKDEKQKKEKY